MPNKTILSVTVAGSNGFPRAVDQITDVVRMTLCEMVQDPVCFRDGRMILVQYGLLKLFKPSHNPNLVLII